jgi:hypothetical protein
LAAARVYAVIAATAEAGQRELALVASQGAFVDPALRFGPQKL